MKFWICGLLEDISTIAFSILHDAHSFTSYSFTSKLSTGRSMSCIITLKADCELVLNSS